MICHNVQKTCLWLHEREGTSKQYQTYLSKWQQYCRERNINIFEPGITNGIEFIVSLYKAGLGKSAINTARSALSSVVAVKDRVKFQGHPRIIFGKYLFGRRFAI